MSNGIGGFFVPSSRSSSYVLSKRNEEGSYKYDAQIGAVGMQKQAALQDLQKTYEATINKAYSSYLANQSAINNSQMGQGYKELYEQKEQENLLAQQAEAAMNVSQVKSQLLSQEQESLSAIKQQYATETANLDRVARSMSDYLGYIKSLEGGVDYLSKLSGKTITDDTLAEDLYESLYAAQPQQLTSMDDPDIKGMAYSEWLHNQMKDTEADRNFEQWLFSGGGWQDFQKSAGLYKYETPEGKAYREIDEARREKVKIAEEQKAKEEAERKAKEEAERKAKEEAERKAKEEAERLSNPNYVGQITNVSSWKQQKRGYGKYDIVTDKGTYKQLGLVQYDSPSENEITDAIYSQLKSGALKKGDIIKYNNKYYIIDDLSKNKKRNQYIQIDYK